MAILDDKALLERIDAFLRRTGMKPTRFGRDATGEASLVASLREGRSPSLRNANKLIDFMDAHEAANRADRDASETGNGGKVSASVDQVAA